MIIFPNKCYEIANLPFILIKKPSATSFVSLLSSLNSIQVCAAFIVAYTVSRIENKI